MRLRAPRRMHATVLALGFVAACRPDFAERDSRVDRMRVLAVRVDPPEAKPGEAVTTSLLVASPDGTVDAPAAFAFCTTPKLLTENGAVSAACMKDGVLPVPPDPAAPAVVTALLPSSGCFDFGPETQSAEVRPRDPDVTGGYFAPIRARVATPAGDPLTAFGFARIACNLANAPGDVATLFSAQYVRNRQPTLLPLEAHLTDGTAVPLSDIPRGSSLVLRAAWRAEDAESYPVFDVRTQTLATRRESLRVSWFATAGDFDHDRTGRTETELETWTDDTWVAPGDARTTHLWVVLRDARGGVAFAHALATTR